MCVAAVCPLPAAMEAAVAPRCSPAWPGCPGSCSSKKKVKKGPFRKELVISGCRWISYWGVRVARLGREVRKKS